MRVRSLLPRRRVPRRGLKVLTYPRDPNPYQELLHDALARNGVRAWFLPERSPSATVNVLMLPVELALARLQGASVFHLHWVFKFVPPAAERLPVGRRAARSWFGLVVGTARLLGYRVVWTAHNLLPHARVFPDDVEARTWLVDRCDAVIAHGPEVGRRIVQDFDGDPTRIAIIPHGPFAPATGAPSRREVRRELGLSDDDVVLGLVGRIDGYKGADDLLDAVARLDDEGALSEHLRIVVAGSCRDDKLRDRLETAARGRRRVVLRLGWLAEEEYAGLTGALDLAVLPFRRVTTSGSAVAALSCGVPVAVPRDLLPDLPATATVRYDDLADVLTDDAFLHGEALARRQRAASSYTQAWSWDDVADATAGAYRGELGPTALTSANDPRDRRP